MHCPTIISRLSWLSYTNIGKVVTAVSLSALRKQYTSVPPLRGNRGILLRRTYAPAHKSTNYC